MELRVDDHAAERAADWISHRIADAQNRRGVALVALSGGSTASPMIDALLACDISWDALHVWQVDERVAPDGHPERNANQLSELPCVVHRMPVTAPDLELSAETYGATLPNRLDVVHLGIGVDGHTASWPPTDRSPIDARGLVVLIPDFNGRQRMTLTQRVVNGARRRVVLATGPSKRVMVERWLLADPTLPISSVQGSDTWVFLDRAAAPDVPLHHRE